MDTSLNQQKEPTKPKLNLSGFLNLKFIIPVIIAAFLITATFGIVMAKKKFADGPGGFMIGMLIEKLDLNETQKTQVEKIRDEIHARMQSGSNDHQTMMEDFASEFTNENMDKNKLMELDQKRQEIMKENKEFMMDKMIEFHNILTPAQRQEAVDLMKNMRGKYGRGKGKGQNGPNGLNCPNCPNCPDGPNGPNGNKWRNDREN